MPPRSDGSRGNSDVSEGRVYAAGLSGAGRADDPKNPKVVMVEVAEKLIGERGIDAVSMRDVAAAAGQRNNSAVQYHFGSREGLIVQVLRRRLAAVEVTRQARLAEIDEQGLGTDLPTLVRVLLEPIVDLLRSQPEATHYARFLQRVGPVMGPRIPEAHLRTATDDTVMRLIDVLSHLPRRVAFERIDLAMQMFTGALAVYEDRREMQNHVVNTRFEDVVAHLYDMTEAALRAGVGTWRETTPLASRQGAASDIADTTEAEIRGR